MSASVETMSDRLVAASEEPGPLSEKPFPPALFLESIRWAHPCRRWSLSLLQISRRRRNRKCDRTVV